MSGPACPDDGPAGQRLLVSLAGARALDLAARSGLLSLFARAAAPVADPAAALGLDPETVGLILQLLADADVVERRSAGWVGRPWLAEADGQLVGGVAGMSAALGAGEDFLRSGACAPAFRGRRHDAATVRGLAGMFGGAAERLAAALPPAGGPVLDLGAGSALWSLAMAVADPATTVVAFDRAPVLQAAAERAASLGLDGRLSLHAGDLLEDAWPAGPFRRIVLANLLHLFHEPRAAWLLQRAAATLGPGGTLVVVDVLAPAGDPVRDAYALQLRMRVPTGTVHALPRLQALLASAGLRPGPALDLASSPDDIVQLGALLAHAAETP